MLSLLKFTVFSAIFASTSSAIKSGISQKLAQLSEPNQKFEAVVAAVDQAIEHNESILKATASTLASDKGPFVRMAVNIMSDEQIFDKLVEKIRSEGSTYLRNICESQKQDSLE